MNFTQLNPDLSHPCPSSKHCFAGFVTSQCVSLPDTKACLDFVDEETLRHSEKKEESGASPHTLQWKKSQQNFYYSWEQKKSVLRASVISNHKRLKIEGKRTVSKLIKQSEQSGGWSEMSIRTYIYCICCQIFPSLIHLFLHLVSIFATKVLQSKSFSKTSRKPSGLGFTLVYTQSALYLMDFILDCNEIEVVPWFPNFVNNSSFGMT